MNKKPRLAGKLSLIAVFILFFGISACNAEEETESLLSLIGGAAYAMVTGISGDSDGDSGDGSGGTPPCRYDHDVFDSDTCLLE